MLHLGEMESAPNAVQVKCCDAQCLRNSAVKLSDNSYEIDRIFRQGINDSRDGFQSRVIEESVTKFTLVDSVTMSVQIAKIIYNDRGEFEDKILLKGTLYRREDEALKYCNSQEISHAR